MICSLKLLVLTRVAVLFAVLALASCELSMGSAQNAFSIGETQQSRPLTIYRVGNGDRTLFLLGGQHGGPEANTARLVELLLKHFSANSGEIPPDVSLYFMPKGNPHGLVNNSRQYASGVDPNRNWDTNDWVQDAYDSNGVFVPGLGGPRPMSEPETAALAEWLLQVHPEVTISYHSAGGFVSPQGGGRALELSRLYAEAAKYPLETAAENRLGYEVTGDLTTWLAGHRMSSIFIELTNTVGPEFQRNLEGVRAVLQRLSVEEERHRSGS
jgi:hypothetical protein